jgi:hypothetical protein
MQASDYFCEQVVNNLKTRISQTSQECQDAG